eukprot:g2060.t1
MKRRSSFEKRQEAAKRAAARRNIFQVLRGVPALRGLNDEFLEVTVDFLDSKEYGVGDYIIKEGEVGHEFYVVESGKVAFGHDGTSDVGGQSKYFKYDGAGCAFGEIALLQECRRTCNVVCMTPVHCFALAKPFFDLLVKQQKDTGGSMSAALDLEFKKAVNTTIFCGLTEEHKQKMVDVMKAHHYLAGAKILNQGEENHKLFIIINGSAEVLQSSNGQAMRPVNKLEVNDFFGELSLLREDNLATATVRASTNLTCVMIPRGQFLQFRDMFEDICMQRALTKHALAENTSLEAQERLCDFATAASSLIADDQMKEQARLMTAVKEDGATPGSSLSNSRSIANIKSKLKRTASNAGSRSNAWKKRQTALSNKLLMMHTRRASQAALKTREERVSSNREHLMTKKERDIATRFHYAGRLESTLYESFAIQMKLRVHDMGEALKGYLLEEVEWLKSHYSGEDKGKPLTSTHCVLTRNLIRGVLNKPILERNELDTSLLRAMIGRLPFWLRYGSILSRANQDNLLMEMQFASFKPQEAIAFQGDVAKKAYLVLGGCIGIYAQDQQSLEASGDDLLDKVGTLVGELGASKSFGHLALDGMSRAPYSYVAKGDVECIEIDISRYLELSDKLPVMKKVHFLQKIPLFDRFDPYRVYNLALMLARQRYRRGDAVLRANEESPFLGFVYQGEIAFESTAPSPPSTQRSQPLTAFACASPTARSKLSALANSRSPTRSSSPASPKRAPLSQLNTSFVSERQVIGESCILNHFFHDKSKDFEVESFRMVVHSSSAYILLLYREAFNYFDLDTVKRITGAVQLKQGWRKKEARTLAESQLSEAQEEHIGSPDDSSDEDESGDGARIVDRKHDVGNSSPKKQRPATPFAGLRKEAMKGPRRFARLKEQDAAKRARKHKAMEELALSTPSVAKGAPIAKRRLQKVEQQRRQEELEKVNLDDDELDRTTRPTVHDEEYREHARKGKPKGRHKKTSTKAGSLLSPPSTKGALSGNEGGAYSPIHNPVCGAAAAFGRSDSITPPRDKAGQPAITNLLQTNVVHLRTMDRRSEKAALGAVARLRPPSPDAVFNRLLDKEKVRDKVLRELKEQRQAAETARDGTPSEQLGWASRKLEAQQHKLRRMADERMLLSMDVTQQSLEHTASQSQIPFIHEVPGAMWSAEYDEWQQ